MTKKVNVKLKVTVKLQIQNSTPIIRVTFLSQSVLPEARVEERGWWSDLFDPFIWTCVLPSGR